MIYISNQNHEVSAQEGSRDMWEEGKGLYYQVKSTDDQKHFLIWIDPKNVEVCL